MEKSISFAKIFLNILDMSKNAIGERIKQLRKSNGFTQSLLGEKLQVSGSTISQYESGEITPSIEVALKLSDLFGVPTHWMLTGDTASQGAYPPGGAAVVVSETDIPPYKSVINRVEMDECQHELELLNIKLNAAQKELTLYKEQLDFYKEQVVFLKKLIPGG
jgi:transcriptional regulator with XRE-family HTH domain